MKITSGVNDAILFWRIAIGCILSVITYFFSTLAFRPDDVSFIVLGVSLFFGLLALLAFRIIFTINKYELDKEKLIIKSIFNYEKRTVHIHTIVSCSEIKNERGTIGLVLFTDTKKIKLPYTIKNYNQFKKILTENKPFKVQEVKNKDSSNIFFLSSLGIAPLLIGLFMIQLSISHFLTRNDEINYSQLKNIQITISKLNIDKEEDEDIYITAKEYPKCKFYIVSTNYRAMNIAGFEKHVSVGKEIQIDIMTEEYDKELAYKQETSFFGSSNTSIGVYGLQKDNTKYLHLEDINSQHKKDYSYFLSFFVTLCGLFMTAFGIFWIYVHFSKD